MKIIYVTRYYGENGGRNLCHRFKNHDRESINTIADAMVLRLQKERNLKGFCLVPIPSHLGKASNTLILAQKISKKLSLPVFNILRCRPHLSNYVSKKQGYPLSRYDIGIWKECELPSNHYPIFVDSVYDTGETMKSAFNAFQKGIALVYSKV